LFDNFVNALLDTFFHSDGNKLEIQAIFLKHSMSSHFIEGMHEVEKNLHGLKNLFCKTALPIKILFGRFIAIYVYKNYSCQISSL